MDRAPAAPTEHFVHRHLDNGVELAVDCLPERETVAMTFRMLCGVADEPDELAGIHAITSQVITKGTAQYDGQALANAFDALGAQWRAMPGRQSMVVRVVCLPEFVSPVIDLVGEIFCRPTFPDEACAVAVDLAQQSLRHMEDEPQRLLQILMHELVMGPRQGRCLIGTPESLALITRSAVRAHWERAYHSGRLQVSVAGAVGPNELAGQLTETFRGLGEPTWAGRDPAAFDIQARRGHRPKDAQQEYLAISLPGIPKGAPEYATQKLLVGVLSGGMSGRLFAEVREKQGLVYWVGAWSEHPRGQGILNLGASTTPQRCEQTYRTLLRELERLSEDLTEAEVERARNQQMAHYQTEDDLTRARAITLSDDLFHFSKPIGLQARLDALAGVSLDAVRKLALALPRERACIATVGPVELPDSA
jgi:predicted Zn-dependent peptidase